MLTRKSRIEVTQAGAEEVPVHQLYLMVSLRLRARLVEVSAVRLSLHQEDVALLVLVSHAEVLKALGR